MEHPLKNIGEFGLIEQIRKWFDEDSGERGGVHGIGDDCSVIQHENRLYELASTDLLIEKTHFILDRTSPGDLGFKSLAVNLSDIAAMGGTPRYFWLSMGLTEQTDQSWMERFCTSMRTLADRHSVRLLGGDTTRSHHHLIINIMVAGDVESAHICYRSAAQPGDIVFVTDVLGDSAGGLKLLMAGRYHTDNPAEQKLIRTHNRPRPFVDEGRWLGRQTGIGALIDISDGIASDARHIANKSGVHIDIRMENIPLSEELQQSSLQYGWDTFRLACSGGEDYSLLGTCRQDHWDKIQSAYYRTFGQKLYAIGDVPDSHGSGVRFLENGMPYLPADNGYDHFKK